MAQIDLRAVEDVLRRETSCIAPQDVAILLKALYEKAQVPFPRELQEEIDEQNENLDEQNENLGE